MLCFLWCEQRFLGMVDAHLCAHQVHVLGRIPIPTVNGWNANAWLAYTSGEMMAF
jgi:hypothetical protein